MPETIVVIGGGIAGVFIALKLAAIGYKKIVLIEKELMPLQGASSIISEAHSGAEYPLDRQSGVDCLQGLIEMRKFLPSELFQKPATRFFLSSGSSSVVSIDGFEGHLEALRTEYERLIRNDFANEVLGNPGSFWSALSREEIRGCRNVIAGFITPQRGIDPALLAAYLTHQLREMGVSLQLGREVTDITKIKEDFLIRTTGLGDGVTFANQVIIAAHYRGFGLAMKVNPAYQPPPIFAALRQIILVRGAPDARKYPSPTYFTLEGSYGAMESPVGEELSLVYHPPVSQIEKIPFSPRAGVPERWEKEMAEPSERSLERGRLIAAGAENVAYPYLHGSVLSRCFLRVAINSVWDSRMRRNPGVEVIVPGCINSSFITKATTAALNSSAVAKLVLNESLRRGLLSPGGFAEGVFKLTSIRLPWMSNAEEGERFLSARREIAKNFYAATHRSLLLSQVAI